MSDFIIGNRKRNTALDSYKGILMILVVFLHVLQWATSDSGEWIGNTIWAIQMPGFMIVSGYLGKRDINTAGELAGRLKKGFLRYFIPFLTWFYLVYVLLLGRHDRNILAATDYVITCIDSAYWFLYTLFCISSYFYLINYFETKVNGVVKKVIIGFLMMVVYAVVLIAITKISGGGVDFLGIKFILYYSCFYFLGHLINELKDTIDTRGIIINKYVSFLCLVVTAVIVFNFDLVHIEYQYFPLLMRLIAGVTGCEVLWCIVKKNERVFEKFKINAIGKYTLEIYCVHMFVLHFIDIDNDAILFSQKGTVDTLWILMTVTVLTGVLIFVIKSIPIADMLFFGNKKK